MYFGLKHRPDFGELLLGEFPKPCSEETKPATLE